MRSRIKTGDVFQIRKNGPNYISLGKVTDTEGNNFIAATRNGNITYSGQMKTVRGGTRKPKIHVLGGNAVKRIHGTRTVDLESVGRTDRTLASHLTRTTSRNGILSDAPNLLVQIADLERSL